MASTQHALIAARIGEVLREQRTKLGFSQSKVAAQADITQDAYWLIEKGRRIPRADTLLKLMHALGIEDTPFSFFADVVWRPATDGLPGMELVIIPSKNGATREFVKAA